MPAERIAALLDGRTPAPDHRPWPLYEIDTQTWQAVGQALGEGGGDLLGLWAHDGAVRLAMRVDEIGPCVVALKLRFGSFPSIGQHHPPAIRLERTIRDLHGHTPVGIPDRRPWLDHGAWGVRLPLGANEPTALRDPAAYDFLPVHGEGVHEIPVGPVHAGIIEPGHFRFTANGETVARLEARLGYVHKGIYGLLTSVELAQAERVIARVSGDATVAYSFAFTLAVEAALGIEAPPRAQVLRGVMAELERIANHLGDIGAICNDAAFALLHAYCGILRERVLQAAANVFGHRLMMNAIIPGGVAQDLGTLGVDAIRATLDEIAPAFAEIVQVYDNTPSLQDRTCTTGIVAADLVARWGAGGHVGRGSGRDFDARRDLAYPPYADVSFKVPVFDKGDVDARVWVRIREVEESMAMIRRWIAALPDGPVHVALPAAEQPCEGIAVAEAFRGDLLVWVRLGANGRVERCHARDASWFQWPLLEAAIEGNIVADFPLCNKSFNCSYSGHDV
jgi:Ni,Fe-hydrogenase III large subunit